MSSQGTQPGVQSGIPSQGQVKDMNPERDKDQLHCQFSCVDLLASGRKLSSSISDASQPPPEADNHPRRRKSFEASPELLSCRQIFINLTLIFE
ncbi:unnamed protein product [Caenorhabditis nigoni]